MTEETSSDPPKVSVIMPSYNHAPFVEQAVRSVWDQTCRSIELIVIDDGSRDGSPAILRRLEAESPIPMRVEVQENRGVTVTLNRALSLARGELVSLLASDDFYDSRFIERNVEEAERQREPVLLHCDGWIVDEQGTVGERVYAVSTAPPATGKCFEDLILSSVRMLSASVVLPRELLLSIGGYDESLKFEDFDLHLRAAREVPFVFIDEPLYYSRELRGSLGRRPWVWADGMLPVLEKHREFIGPHFDELMVQRFSKLSHLCFAHGGWRHGGRWGWRALMAAPARRRRATAKGVAKAMISGAADFLGTRVVPRPLRRQLKKLLR